MLLLIADMRTWRRSRSPLFTSPTVCAGGLPPVETWNQLMYVMTKRYVPEDHKESMRVKIALATQGSKTPLEFFSELEDLLHKGGVQAGRTAFRTMFLRGLDEEIRDKVRPLGIKDPTRLAHTAMDFYEQQQRQRQRRAAWARAPPRYPPNLAIPLNTNSNSSLQPRTPFVPRTSAPRPAGPPAATA